VEDGSFVVHVIFPYINLNRQFAISIYKNYPRLCSIYSRVTCRSGYT